MAKMICLFSHKSGVGKTTAAFHLGWMLTEKGKRVLLVDADSQCNLTSIVFGDDFEQFYIDNPKKDIKQYLSAAFEGSPMLISPAEVYPVQENQNLGIIPGSFELSEYEVSLAVSFTLSDAMRGLKNLPGSFRYFIDKTAEKYFADYVIVDMNPSLSAINQTLLVSSDFFIVPAAPDNFSEMAIRSLSKILPRWEKWAKRARKAFEDAIYPLPHNTPKFLGTIIQRFNVRNGKPTKANNQLIDSIAEIVQKTFIPNLKLSGMLLENDNYVSEDFCLAQIPDFQTLNAKYQTYGIPVFALSDGQLDAQGKLLENYKDMRDRFYDIFSGLADKVIQMTT